MIDFLYVPSPGPNPADPMETVALVQMVADRPETLSYSAADLLLLPPGETAPFPPAPSPATLRGNPSAVAWTSVQPDSHPPESSTAGYGRAGDGSGSEVLRPEALEPGALESADLEPGTASADRARPGTSLAEAVTAVVSAEEIAPEAPQGKGISPEAIGAEAPQSEGFAPQALAPQALAPQALAPQALASEAPQSEAIGAAVPQSDPLSSKAPQSEAPLSETVPFGASIARPLARSRAPQALRPGPTLPSPPPPVPPSRSPQPVAPRAVSRSPRQSWPPAIVPPLFSAPPRSVAPASSPAPIVTWGDPLQTAPDAALETDLQTVSSPALSQPRSPQASPAPAIAQTPAAGATVRDGIAVKPILDGQIGNGQIGDGQIGDGQIGQNRRLGEQLAPALAGEGQDPLAERLLESQDDRPDLAQSTRNSQNTEDPGDIENAEATENLEDLEDTEGTENAGETEQRDNAEEAETEADPARIEGIGNDALSIIDLKADLQTYDSRRQIMIAEGNAFLRFNGGAIVADRIQYNVNTKFVRAEGNVKFRRGQQRISGDVLEYNLVQERGTIEPATGQIFNAESDQDLDFGAVPSQGLPSDNPAILFPENPPLVQPRQVGETLITTGFGTSFGGNDTTNGNPENVVSAPLEVSSFRQTGTINHWRYQADRVDLLPDGWVADRANLTNDPFNPGQFRLRTDSLDYREITPLVSEVRADRPRYIFDNGLSLPTFRDRVLIDRRAQDAGLFSIGYEGNDRGGLFIERTFEPISRENIRLNFTPQFLLQKTLLGSETDADPDNPIPVLSSFALRGNLWAQVRPGTQVTGEFVATDLGAIGTDQFEETFRGNLRLQQALPLQHTLALEASFRDRLFNGSLGYQTIHSSFGAVVYSPTFLLGDTGLTLRYQGGIQNITADTDRPDLLKPIRPNNRATLMRYQASATLGRGFTLWRGEPLPATPTLGLRYTPSPVVPQITLNTGITGIYSIYGNGETQESLTGSLGVTGTFGHHSRSWFDFTQLNATYSRALRGGESPFLFDRIADSQAIGVGIRQQIYGPILVGFQTGVNLDTGEEFSRDYSLEYQRRAFNIALRYNPEREVGSLTFRIYDFAW